MGSKQYHHGDLKASLIAVANTILLRDGADALSLRAIASEAGVSHMAPYAHFKNKKELINSIAEAGFEQLAHTMEIVSVELNKKKSVTSGELVFAYGASYLEFATSNPQLYRLMLGQVETTGRKSKAKGKEEKEKEKKEKEKKEKEVVKAVEIKSSDQPNNAIVENSLTEDSLNQGVTGHHPIIKAPVVLGNKKPFILLREAFALQGDNEEKITAQALGAWSMVHGMAALIIEGHIQVPDGVSFKHFLASAIPFSIN